ncbi:hypothetical protein DPEC_G00062720 [Dallia pectoralis]|uniref:Uncharacterized protein n=1 Tax=Dallia pectoralis TaxID=75939 RepID=A0ACC2H7Y1_DALPE|nr:hypothetical protein DPEC_G00062720 [Dallia pectoralis]
MNLKEVVIFLDDLIVFSKTLEDHEARLNQVLKHLKEYGLLQVFENLKEPILLQVFENLKEYGLLQVLKHLKEYGLKLSPEKCRFFQSSVRYLGYVVSEQGVETDPEKIAALKTWPVPQHLKELKAFLGFSCQQAFEMIIGKLTTSPVLAFANPALPYIHHTDASSTGLGAALYQEQEGQLRVITYASRGYRWLAALSTFSFKLQYPPGKQNGDADALSRRLHGDLRDDPSFQKEWDRIRRFTQHHLPDPDNIEAVDQGVVRAICERKRIYCANDGMSKDGSISLVESLAISGDAVPDSFEREDELGGLPIVPHLSEADLGDKQKADQCIKHVISQIERGETPPPTVRAKVRAVLPDLPP